MTQVIKSLNKLIEVYKRKVLALREELNAYREQRDCYREQLAQIRANWNSLREFHEFPSNELNELCQK
jgi:uncharacterized coiled-coil DUF342 family protein